MKFHQQPIDNQQLPFMLHGLMIYFFDMDLFSRFRKYTSAINSELISPEVNWDEIRGLLTYYLPYLQEDELAPSHSWLSALRFNGILPENFKPRSTVVFRNWRNFYYADLSTGTFEELVQLYFEHCKLNNSPLYSPIISHEESYPLDEETQKIVDEIAHKLRELNSTGKFLFALPDIQRHLQEFSKMQKPEISQIYVDDNYRIFLTDYGNKEIKLNHLTKALYFLHLLNERLSLEDIRDKRKTLSNLYKTISYRNDTEQLEESIDKLLENNNNELFVHYSRVKSAFLRVIADDFAMHYYIRGDKGKPKGIEIDKSKILFEMPLQF